VQFGKKARKLPKKVGVATASAKGNAANIERDKKGKNKVAQGGRVLFKRIETVAT